MKRFIFALIAFVVSAFAPEGAKADDIVNWHTLRVTANYEADVKATKENEYLFVWVGDSVDYKVFTFLEQHHVRQSYAPSLAGTKNGLIIGRGQHLYKSYDTYTLTDPKVLSQIDVLLHEPMVIVPRAKETLVQVQGPKNIVSSQPSVAMHKHQCGNCGTVWAHNAGGSHMCPYCGSGPWLYHYQGARPAQYIH